MNTDSDFDPTAADSARESLRESLRADAARWSGGDQEAPSEPGRGEAFVSWMLQSARLAALGDETVFRLWPGLASTLGVDVERAIAWSAGSGIRRLESAAGSNLALEIGVSEDASCLACMEPLTTDLLGRGGGPVHLAAWRDAASGLLLDEDAIDAITARRVLWPLPPDIRLPVVETPLSASDLILGGHRNDGPSRLVPKFVHAEELAMFDDGRPTPGMIDRFSKRRGEGITRSGRRLDADAELDPYWQITVEVRTEDVGVRTVRIGPMSLESHPDLDGVASEVAGTTLWSTSLHGLPLDVRTRIVCGDISIRTDEGDRFLL